MAAQERLNRRMRDLENVRPPPMTPQGEVSALEKGGTFLTETSVTQSPRPTKFSQVSGYGSPAFAARMLNDSGRKRPTTAPNRVARRPSQSPYSPHRTAPRTSQSKAMPTVNAGTSPARKMYAPQTTPYSQSPGIFPPVSATAHSQKPHKKNVDRATNTMDPSGQLYDDTVAPAIDWLDDYFDSQIENCLSSLPPLLEEEYALSKKWHINRVTQALTDPLAGVLWANHVELYDRAISLFRVARQQKDKLAAELASAESKAEEALVDKKFLKSDHVMQISAMADLLQKKRMKKRDLKNKILELNAQVDEYRQSHTQIMLGGGGSGRNTGGDDNVDLDLGENKGNEEEEMAKKVAARAAATEEQMEGIVVQADGSEVDTTSNLTAQAKAIENLQGMLLASHKRVQQLAAEVKGKTQMIAELQAHKEAGMGLERFIRNGEFDLVEMFNVILNTKEIWSLRTSSLVNNTPDLVTKFTDVIDTFKTEEQLAAEEEEAAKAKKAGHKVKKKKKDLQDEVVEKHILSVKERRALLNLSNALRAAVSNRAAEPLTAINGTQTVSIHKLMREKTTQTVDDLGLDAEVERRVHATPEIAIYSPLNFYKGKYKGSYIPIRLLTKTITRIYNEYLEVEHSVSNRRHLPEFVLDFFYQQYGLKSLADNHLEKFVASIMQYEKGSRKVKNFASFCLISPPYYPHADFEFFLDLLHYCRSSKVGMVFSDSEDGTEWISWYRAMEATRAAIGHQLSIENFREVCMNIDKLGVAVPIKKDRRKQAVSISPTESRVILILQKINDFLSHNSSLNLKGMFNSFDIDGDGELDPDEFRKGLRSIQIDLEDEEFSLLVRRFDRNQNGKISYHEMQEKLNNLQYHTKIPLDSFQRVMLFAWHSEIERREEKMKKLFLEQDVNKDGVLTFQEFQNLVNAIDPETSSRDVHLMYRESVSNDNDGMDVDEFILAAHKYNLGSKRDKRIARDTHDLTSSGRAPALDSALDLNALAENQPTPFTFASRVARDLDAEKESLNASNVPKERTIKAAARPGDEDLNDPSTPTVRKSNIAVESSSRPAGRQPQSRDSSSGGTGVRNRSRSPSLSDSRTFGIDSRGRQMRRLSQEKVKHEENLRR